MVVLRRTLAVRAYILGPSPGGGGRFSIRGDGAKGSSSGRPRRLGPPEGRGPPLLDERRALVRALDDGGANALVLLVQQAPRTMALRREDTMVTFFVLLERGEEGCEREERRDYHLSYCLSLGYLNPEGERESKEERHGFGMDLAWSRFEAWA